MTKQDFEELEVGDVVYFAKSREDGWVDGCGEITGIFEEDDGEKYATIDYKNKKYYVDPKDIEEADCTDIVRSLRKKIKSLENQLKNAIVPRFKINQTIYFFNDCCVMASGQIGDIKTHKSYCGDDECENFVSYTIYVDNNSYATDYEREEEYVFATTEEAGKKLEELKE